MGEKRRLRVTDNRVLRRIFWPKRDEVRGEWRELHNEERNDMHSPPNIIGIIKSRMRWAKHVASKGKRGGAYRILVGSLRERDHLEESGVDGRKILRLILRKCNGGVEWIDLAQYRDGWRALVNAVMNVLFPSNEGEFLD